MEDLRNKKNAQFEIERCVALRLYVSICTYHVYYYVYVYFKKIISKQKIIYNIFIYSIHNSKFGLHNFDIKIVSV